MTIDFYNQQSQAFFEQTVHVDMQEIYEPFLALLSPGSHLLDAGCGSGRDTKAFLDRGYQVTAIDASEAMVQLSSELTGQRTLLMSFTEMAFACCFDGIWACASLLHVPLSEIHPVIEQFARALKPKGIWYLSFKLGNGEQWREGRLFNDFDEEHFTEVMSAHPDLEILDLWQTDDRRPTHSQKQWFNALVTKQPCCSSTEVFGSIRRS